MSHKKGIYIDGYEQEDVVKYRGGYLETYENNHVPRPRCSDEESLTPSTAPPTEHNDEKLVVIYQD